MVRRITIVVTVMAVLAGCRNARPSAWLTASSSVVRPGQRFTVRVHHTGGRDVVRGVASDLDRWDGAEWHTVATLLSPTVPEGEPSVFDPTIRDGVVPAVEAIGITGEWNDPVVLPAVPPGRYRVRKSVTAQTHDGSHREALSIAVEVRVKARTRG